MTDCNFVKSLWVVFLALCSMATFAKAEMSLNNPSFFVIKTIKGFKYCIVAKCM